MLTALLMTVVSTSSSNLIQNGGFEAAPSGSSVPTHFELKGAATWSQTGYKDEWTTLGIALDSSKPEGSVSQMVSGIDQAQGKWLNFTGRVRAEDGFKVEDGQFYIHFDFYSGDKYLDSAERLVYKELQKDRKDLTANGDYGKGGAATWRTYQFEEMLPFKEANGIKITFGFRKGAGEDKPFCRAFLDDFVLEQRQTSARGAKDPALTARATPLAPSTDGMTPLGGRWYYKPAAGEVVTMPLVVDYHNSDRLFYKAAELSAPFAGNMSSWLRSGMMDSRGQVVGKDREVKDAFTITFSGDGWMTLHSKDLPNHTIAKFPDTYGSQGYNPNYVMEQNLTVRVPVDPQLSEDRVAMTERDANYALPMGPIGLAVNGVEFFNPFDANMTDASSIMDRCCGHPAPDYAYHYHKYPICVNTMFSDRGEKHSPLIGLAFDGFPVYGPYEVDGVMAKDYGRNPLDGFNAHYDSERGWHYHVSPGKYPYLLGGFLGKVQRMRR